MVEPSPTRTEETPYAGYGGYYSTPEEASASIRAHSPRYGGGGSSSSRASARRDWSKNPPKTKEEWAQYMVEASITSQGDILYPAAIVTEHGVYPVTKEGLARTPLKVEGAVYYEARREGDKIVYTHHKLTPQELKTLQELSRERGSVVSVSEVREEIARKKELERRQAEAARRQRREARIASTPRQARKYEEPPPGSYFETKTREAVKKLRARKEFFEGPDLPVGERKFDPSKVKGTALTQRGAYEYEIEIPEQPTHGIFLSWAPTERLLTETEYEFWRRGVPIHPLEKMGAEEELLLRWLEFWEPVTSQKPIGGLSQAAPDIAKGFTATLGEIAESTGIVGYAGYQIAKRPTEAFTTIREHGRDLAWETIATVGAMEMEAIRAAKERPAYAFGGALAIYPGLIKAPKTIGSMAREAVEIRATPKLVEISPDLWVKTTELDFKLHTPEALRRLVTVEKTGTGYDIGPPGPTRVDYYRIRSPALEELAAKTREAARGIKNAAKEIATVEKRGKGYEIIGGEPIEVEYYGIRSPLPSKMKARAKSAARELLTVEKEGKGYEVVGDTLREVDVYRVRSPLLEKAASRAVEKAKILKERAKERAEALRWRGLKDLENEALQEMVDMASWKESWRMEERGGLRASKPPSGEIGKTGTKTLLLIKEKPRPVRVRVKGVPPVVAAEIFSEEAEHKGYKPWMEGLERGMPRSIIGLRPRSEIAHRKMFTHVVPSLLPGFFMDRVVGDIPRRVDMFKGQAGLNVLDQLQGQLEIEAPGSPRPRSPRSINPPKSPSTMLCLKADPLTSIGGRRRTRGRRLEKARRLDIDPRKIRRWLFG